jgi:hypothetical protein
VHLGLLVKCQIFLSDFNPIWIFSTDFHRSPQYQDNENPLGAKLIHMERQTNRKTGRQAVPAIPTGFLMYPVFIPTSL